MFDVFYKDQIKSIQEACKLSRTRYLWILDRHNDYFEFDLSWEPPPWEKDYTHIWPSQYQSNGGTILVSKNGSHGQKYHTKVVPRIGHAPRLHIKFNSTSEDQGDVNTRYISNYKDTIRRVLTKTDWEYCWVTSDVCDYRDFDFSWHPSEWQQDMLHVFASNDQKFGDTFYIHVPSFLSKTEELEVLEWFETLNFVENIIVPRPLYDTVRYNNDNLVDAVWNHKFEYPYSLFFKDKMVHAPTISLWQENTKTVVPLCKGGEVTLIPREVKNYLNKQIYDYPWIDRSREKLIQGHPQDIVFISNGESNADRNWQHLLQCTKNIPNRVVRVDGVNGRAQAYKAAVSASKTDWAFCVFAKLEVNPDFDWSWQPDRLQASKHYIFHAQNPVNGLEYGHMAMIAYNKKLTLANEAKGLDFTLDSEHEVVPLLSGVARYAEDPWIAWRSAFRECVKLKHSLPNIENEFRLQQWLTKNLQGDTIGDWSIKGARDAVDYFDSVKGSFEALHLTYEWSWLEDYFLYKYAITPYQLCTEFINQ